MSKTVLIENKDLQPKLLVVMDGHFTNYVIDKITKIGRSTENNKVDINLQKNFVSREQGIIDHDAHGCFYIDTGSSNGTYYNGKKLLPQMKQYLSNGDVLHVFNGNDTSVQSFVALVFITDYPPEYSESVVKLTESIAEINVGRTGNKQVLMQDETVSVNHASFFTAKNGWAIVDHSSTNGVFLNNVRIRTAKYLRVGDCIRIAKTHFVFLGDRVIYQQVKSAVKAVSKEIPANDIPLSIHIVERSVWQRAKKLMLLQNIDVTIHSGEMVLILGGSGAGKTTFMNAVMGYEKAEGKIMHGSTDIYEDFESMKYKIGFVPQQDLIRDNDTVYDTLENAAEMKLSSMKKDLRKERIDTVLSTLGLQREADSLVSKLSGGQRKRLSIAIEYIADPSLFFLDEPDSGLDGVMAKTLMQNLRCIADEGRIVMVISHAPDRVSDLFDKVIVLAKSVQDNCGHLAFFGLVQQTYDFFNTDSLEGVVKRINRTDEGGEDKSDYYIEKYNVMMGGE